MASLNRALVIGNLGQDPELRATGGGQSVATLRVATNERWTDKAGQTQERTEWHSIVVWGKQAEQCKEYLTKGSQIFAEGRLQTREWTDKEGHKRFSTEIVAQRVLFLGRRGEGGGGAPRSSGGFGGGASSGSGSTTSQDQGPPLPEDDDIPF